jgi:hypothetical protein
MRKKKELDESYDTWLEILWEAMRRNDKYRFDFASLLKLKLTRGNFQTSRNNIILPILGGCMPFFFRPLLVTAVLVTAGFFELLSVSFAASVNLAWDKPDPQEESLIGGYKIYYGKVGGTYGRPLIISKAKIDRDNQNNPTYIVTVNGLSPGQQYFFEVTAYNMWGESGRSNGVRGKPQAYVIKTDPPGRKVVVNNEVTSATPKMCYWVTDLSPPQSHPVLYTVSVPSPQTSPSGTTRYLYSSWSDGGDQTHTITPPSYGQTYTVSFSTQYALTTSANIAEAGSLSITPDPQETKWYNKGEVVTFSAMAKPGYIFLGWSTGSRSNPLSIPMNGPRNVMAIFRKDQYSIRVSINPSKGGSVKKTPNKSTYGSGDLVTLTATPKNGYMFAGWSGDISGPADRITITMDGTKSIVANFSMAVATSFESSLIGNLESPFDGKSVSGVQPIYGWALDGEGISEAELFVDGVYAGRIPYGGIRQDIGELLPGYPNARQSGFAWNLDHSRLSPGEHSIEVKVHSRSGRVLDLGARVSVKKFHGQNIEGITPGAALMSDVDVTADGLTKTYDLRFGWSPASQRFRISAIEEKNRPTEKNAGSQTVISFSPALDEDWSPEQVPPECAGVGSTVSPLPLIGCLENPKNNDKVSGIQTIHGWALDEKGVSRIELIVDGVYVSDIPYGGTREDLREAYPTYPSADQSGFALMMNYSTLSPGSHTIKLKIHNQNNETVELSTNVFVEKFHGEFVNQVTPYGGWLYDVNVTSDGITRTYDVNLQWSNESQSFEITEIIQKSD